MHTQTSHSHRQKNSRGYEDPCDVIFERSPMSREERRLRNVSLNNVRQKSSLHKIAFDPRAAAKQTRINHRLADPIALILGGKPRTGPTIRELEKARDVTPHQKAPSVNVRAMLVRQYGRTIVKEAERIQGLPSDSERHSILMGHHLPETHCLRRMLASKPVPCYLGEVCERVRTLKNSGK